MIINCPYCSGPIVRDLQISVGIPVGVEISFDTKCAHCQKPVKIRAGNTGMQVFVNNKLIEKLGIGEESNAAIRKL